MNNQEVLLVGGMGFVGCRLQTPLLETGYRVHVIDRKKPDNKESARIKFHASLLSDESVLRNVLNNCSTVFYLASDSVPTTTVRQPSREGELNLQSFLKFLDVFQDYSNVHLVYLSSGGTMYGNPETVPVSETHPVAPISYHGAGKAAIEAFLHVISNQCDNRVTILRPSNLYGPYQPYARGFGIIRSMMEKLKLNQPMEIWGDGEVIRDYLYIDDFVSACLACNQLQGHSKRIRIFNVSSGLRLSINQLCHEIEGVTGRRLQKVYLPGRAVDVKSVILDNSRIKQELGWQPVVGIHEGLKRMWEWLKILPI